jgi:RNA polymerase sigma-70 factor, ECF subfamily
MARPQPIDPAAALHVTARRVGNSPMSQLLQPRSGGGLLRMSDSDSALVARTLGGDLHAYTVLMARYRDKFGRYAFHMLGNREDAQEALQDSFVRAYRGLATCRQPDRFGAWLFTIVVNRCRTVRRRLQRDRRFDAELPDDVPSGGARPDSFEWRDEIGQALDRLRPHYREAFLLRYVEGLEYAEMSEMTGAKEPALRMRVKRASDQLRELLRDVHAG